MSRYHASAAATGATDELITVERSAVALSDEVYQLVCAQLRTIAVELGIKKCHFQPLKTNDSYNLFSYKTREEVTDLIIGQQHLQYALLQRKKCPESTASSEKKKASQAQKMQLQINLHEHHKFMQSLKPIRSHRSEAAFWVNFTQRVSMWFAASSHEDTADYLATEPFPEIVKVAIRKFLDDNPTAELHFIYDPLLLAAGDRDQTLIELQSTYQNRLHLLDVNQTKLFYADITANNEKIVYWLARYLLALARDPDVTKRKSISMVTVKDLLQLLTAVYVRGNIMDCIYNLLLFPSRIENPRDWEELSEPRDSLFDLHPRELSKDDEEAGEDLFQVSNEMFVPVFIKQARHEQHLTQPTRDFFVSLIIAVLKKFLVPLEQDFSKYLKTVLQKQQADALIQKVASISTRVDRKSDICCSSSKLSFLTLFSCGDLEISDDTKKSILELISDIFKNGTPSYLELCYFYRTITFDDWRAYIDIIEQRAPGFIGIMQEGGLPVDEETFDLLLLAAIDSMVYYFAGSSAWQETLASRKPSKKDCKDLSIQSACIMGVADDSKYIPLSSFLWGGAQAQNILKYYLLMWIDPAAHQLIYYGNRCVFPREMNSFFVFSGILADASRSNEKSRAIGQLLLKKKEALCRELGLNLSDDRLLEKALQVHQHGEAEAEGLSVMLSYACAIFDYLEADDYFRSMKQELTQLLKMMVAISNSQSQKYALRPDHHFELFENLFNKTRKLMVQDGMERMGSRAQQSSHDSGMCLFSVEDARLSRLHSEAARSEADYMSGWLKKV